MAVSLLLGSIFCVVVLYAYLRYQSVKAIKKALSRLLPPPQILTWRISQKRIPASGSPRFAGNTDFPNIDGNAVNPMDFPEYSAGNYVPDKANWMKYIAVTPAALDGFIHTSKHFAEFSHLDGDTLQHIGAKTIDLIAKIEPFSLGSHLMIAAEHGHEAWLTALGTLLAKHMVASSIEHAVATHHDVAAMSAHAGASAGDAPHHTLAGDFHGAAAGEHAGMLADIHFPLITILFSSYRELKLLLDDKTTAVRALKNVVVDGAGVAGGIALGAKGGAAIGAAVGGPAGAAIGAVVGAIIGGIGGKVAATSARVAGFEKAKEAYISGSEAAQKAVDSLLQQSQAEIKQQQELTAAEFEHNRVFVMEEAQRKLSPQIEVCQARFNRFANQFPDHLDQLARQVEIERYAILAHIPGTRFGFIWPGRADVMRQRVSEWFDQAVGTIASERARYRTLPDQSLRGRLAEIRRFLAQYQFELEQLDQDIREVMDVFDETNLQARQIEVSAIDEVERARQSLSDRFIAAVKSKTEEINEKTARKKEEILQLWNKLKTEADAVGVALASEASGA